MEVWRRQRRGADAGLSGGKGAVVIYRNICETLKRVLRPMSAIQGGASNIETP